MNITREFHFHAAHRNQHLVGDKCFNLHGHTYRLWVTVAVDEVDVRSGVSVAFGEIEQAVQPIVNELDHSLLIDMSDPLYEHMLQFYGETGQNLKMLPLDGATSAENLIDVIHRWLMSHTDLRIARLRLQETTSTYVEAEYPV